MLQDLADCFRTTISPYFGLTHYGQQIAESASSFDELATFLDNPPDPIERLMLSEAANQFTGNYDVVCCTCPFPEIAGILTLSPMVSQP